MAHWAKIGVAIALSGAMHIAGALEINSANEAELDSVRGFGPETTARILLARDRSPFASWEDLMRRVKGIKSGMAIKLSADGLTVNGLSFAGHTLNSESKLQPAKGTVAP